MKEQDKQTTPEETQEGHDKLSRRKLLATMGMTGAAVAVAGGAMSSLGQTAFAASSSVGKDDDKDSRYFDDASRLSYRYEEKLTERTIGDKLRETYSVKDFGAVGDGQADDTEAFRAALSQVNKHKNGAMVVVPDGEYRITSHITIYSNTTLNASPNAVIKRDHDGYLLMNGERETDYYGYDGQGNIQILGGIWDHNGGKHGQAICISIGHGDNIQIKNITVLDVPGSHAIEINSSRNVTVSDSRFLGFSDPNDNRGFSEAIQLDLARGSSVFPPFGAYDMTACKKITITNCYFGKSEKMGSWGRAIGSHSSTIGRWHEEVTITNNVFDDMSHQAVRTYSWESVIIANNTFLNCGGAVGVYPPLLSKAHDTEDENGKQTNKSQACEQYVIANNVVWGGQTYSPAISISGQKEGGFIIHVAVTGNTISHSEGGSQSIYINNAKRINVTGNNITGSNSNGIAGSNGELFKIEGNIIHDVDSLGIQVKAVKQATVANNDLKDVGTHGVYVTDKSDMVNVANNNILDVNRSGEDDVQHIRVTATNSRVSIVGNICQQENGSAEGLRITNTNTDVVRTGNIFTGLTIRDNDQTTVGVDLE